MSLRVITAVAAALLVAAGACRGGDDDTSPTATPFVQTSTAAPATTSGASATAFASPTPGGGTTYTVQSGDTLNSIAADFGVSVDAIIVANGIDDPTLIQVGQELIIPGGDDPVATPTPGTSTTTVATAPSSGDVGLLTPVDKEHALPEGYVPPGVTAIGADYVAPAYAASLRGDVIAALTEMLDAAYAASYDIRVVSGYRSYDQQVTTFNYWVNTLGYDEAIRISAMPGHSEHQLGTTVDLGTADVGWALTEGFGETPGGLWLEANAHTYGFALSYPDGSEAITGYAYEPWHFRYIGDEAAAWKASGQTLNQYLAQ